MRDKKSESSRQVQAVPTEMVEEGYVVLPFNEGQFRDFIKSLLGSPQSISRSFDAAFEIDRNDIRNLYYLLCQRVTQQNEGILAQFTAKIIYSDDSSIELNSLKELLTYNEVRPVVSRAVHLTWDFVVRFQDKETPEKQRIQVSFGMPDESAMIIDGLPMIGFGRASGSTPGFISFRIEYTARTWGADIEALLTNHIKSLSKEPPRLKQLVREHSGKIAFLFASALFLIAVVGGFVSAQQFGTRQLAELNRLLQTHTGSSLEAVAARMDEIAAFIATNPWSQHSFALLVLLVISATLAVAFGIWIEGSVVSDEPSFILLTKQAHKDKGETLKRHQKKWLRFALLLCLDIVVGIASNVIFSLCFT